ncbi:hypothetical protein E6R60_06110 [Streptomyces sp. A0642]|uniref:hypothetical protein n=1 Tax=Streptomyces sp. A0642 TaxID=2563100 RepID=UPI0010A20CD5|nr:hypothetical protein [Streptomyces sp. A0642]THA78449.1 hypothetical protein E6R60_06110 [Streptomyces sp. A0642]
MTTLPGHLFRRTLPGGWEARRGGKASGARSRDRALFRRGTGPARVKGRLKTRTKRGDDVYEAGQTFSWAPGHAPEALENCEYLDFSPTKEFNEVVHHIKAQTG